MSATALRALPAMPTEVTDTDALTDAPSGNTRT
jgi:hypothetical protein